MKGYDDLTKREKAMFGYTHISHLESIAYEEREQYLNPKIKKIERDEKEGCLKVYFKNGERFSYCMDVLLEKQVITKKNL